MKLTLVGAGPGDEELITLKAIRSIEEADVILYDALANEGLLKYANAAAEIIYVGKRLGMHSVSQDEINRIILQNCLGGKHVLRLKGGDPIVFGRGFEEKKYVEAFGIKTEIVSGITSAVAAPTSAGIPVTMRGVSESFWVLTGHTKERELPKDMYLAAQSNATIIVLMGLSKLEEICQIFKNEGKGELPVAIIEKGTHDDERVLVGVVDTIVKLNMNAGLRNPAVLVFGEVVKCRPSEFTELVAAEVYKK